VEAPRLGPRLGADRLHQRRASGTVGLECLGLAARVVEGEQPQAVEPLAQRCSATRDSSRPSASRWRPASGRSRPPTRAPRGAASSSRLASTCPNGPPSRSASGNPRHSASARWAAAPAPLRARPRRRAARTARRPRSPDPAASRSRDRGSRSPRRRAPPRACGAARHRAAPSSAHSPVAHLPTAPPSGDPPRPWCSRSARAGRGRPAAAVHRG
jgi:hypothetical protein